MMSCISHTSPLFRVTIAASLIVAFAFVFGSIANAQSQTVLYNFGGNSGGYGPITVATDGSGNFYGIGASGNGIVYKLTQSGGVWTESAIHKFTGAWDGYAPAASIAFDSAGNIYGSSVLGGKSAACSSTCAGVVWELSPPGAGQTTWKLTALHTFIGGTAGASPIALTRDAAGNLYGMTETGGNLGGVCANDSGCGTIFRLSPQAGGGWLYTRLHTFSGTDGLQPQGNLVIDSAGNLYGSTSFGGNAAYCTAQNEGGCGVVFRLAAASGPPFVETVLYRFHGFKDGALPSTYLARDLAGNLYGATSVGGTDKQELGAGVIFQLTPAATVPWTYTGLHIFSGTDGSGSNGGINMDSAGNLFGTTIAGGNTGCNCGTVFELSPDLGGYTFNSVYSFPGNPNGLYPVGNLVIGSSGVVYGIAVQGGSHSGGVFYQLVLP